MSDSEEIVKDEAESPGPILLRQNVPLEAYKPRVYLSGFPKAGLHMLEQMVRVLVSPATVGTGGSQWLGTYKWHSFSMIWQNMRQVLWRMSCLERGTYLMGHAGYDKRLARLLKYANIGHIFIYRDLRDIAVSQAHHIYDVGENRAHWQHEHKDLYRMLGSFDATLLAVIEGLGPYPGVVERWVEYAPWLKNKQVLALRYEDLLGQTIEMAVKILVYLMKNATDLLEGNRFGIDMDPEDAARLTKKMAASTVIPSPTFRRGVAGGWRDEFTPEHVEAFKKSDPNGWLVRLGYEQDGDW